MSQQQLPKEWKWIKLSEVCDIISRGRQPHYGMGNAYTLKSAQVYPDRIRWKNAPSVTDDFAQKQGDVFALRIDDVLLNGTGTGTIGRSAYVQEQPTAVYIPDGHINLIRTNKRRCLGAYVFYWLQTEPALAQINLSISGSTNQVELASSKVSQFSLPLPSLPVQRAIVTILNKADNVRLRRSEAHYLLLEVSNALFVEILGHPATNPQKWPEFLLGDLLEQVRRPIYTQADDSYKQVTVRWYGKGAAVRSHGLGSERKTKRQYLVRKDDFIYSRIDARKGAFAIAGADIDNCIVTSDFPTFKINLEFVRSAFVEVFIRLPYFWNKCAQASVGTTNRTRLNEAELLKISIPIPPLEEQDRFIQANNQLLSSLMNQDTSVIDTNALFASILTQAFTGELIAEWEAVNAERIAVEETRLERRSRRALLDLIALRQQRRPEAIGITCLMKYTFLAQNQGEVLSQLANHLYDFVPYHYGPFAQDLYNDLTILEEEGWIKVERVANTLFDTPERTDILLNTARSAELEAELAGLSDAERADLFTVVEKYGALARTELLEVVYTLYPAYARKSRLLRSRS